MSRDRHTTGQQPPVLPGLAKAAATAGVRKAVYAAGSWVVGTVGWPALLIAAAVMIIFVIIVAVILIIALMRMPHERNLFDYQCQSRLGYSVGNTATLTAVPHAVAPQLSDVLPQTTWETTALQPATTTTTNSSPLPTTTKTPTLTTATSSANPYASLTIPPSADPKIAACVNALRAGQLLGAPLTTPGTELGRSAANLANAQVGVTATDNDGDTAGPTNHAFSAANLIRYAYFQASDGKLTLPTDPARQITVGDRVDNTAISPGDLVFFNFTPTRGPTSVVIAISPYLGIDATNRGRPIAVAVLPHGNVIVKRPNLKELTPQ